MRVELYGCKGNAALSSPKLAYHFLAEPPPYVSNIATCGHKTEKPPAHRSDPTVSKYMKIFVPTLTTAPAQKLPRQRSTH